MMETVDWTEEGDGRETLRAGKHFGRGYARFWQFSRLISTVPYKEAAIDNPSLVIGGYSYRFLAAS